MDSTGSMTAWSSPRPTRVPRPVTATPRPEQSPAVPKHSVLEEGCWHLCDAGARGAHFTAQGLHQPPDTPAWMENQARVSAPLRPRPPTWTPPPSQSWKGGEASVPQASHPRKSSIKERVCCGNRQEFCSKHRPFSFGRAHSARSSPARDRTCAPAVTRRDP